MKNVMIEYDPINVRWMGYHTALKQFFDDTAGLPDLPKNDKNEDGKNVKVIYATPSSAFTKYVIPMVNGLTQRPIISFYLSNEETVNEVSGNPITSYRYYTERKDGGFEQTTFGRPVMKSLSYRCNIFTTKMADCDYLLTLLECQCNKFRPFSTKVNGRPAQYYLDDVETGTPVEYEGKKFIRSSFVVTVPRAMIFPAEIETDVAIIKKITTYLYDETGLEIDDDIIKPHDINENNNGEK